MQPYYERVFHVYKNIPFHFSPHPVANWNITIPQRESWLWHYSFAHSFVIIGMCTNKSMQDYAGSQQKIERRKLIKKQMRRIHARVVSEMRKKGANRVIVLWVESMRSDYTKQGIAVLLLYSRYLWEWLFSKPSWRRESHHPCRQLFAPEIPARNNGKRIENWLGEYTNMWL